MKTWKETPRSCEIMLCSAVLYSGRYQVIYDGRRTGGHLNHYLTPGNQKNTYQFSHDKLT